jgi:anti-sigma factor ChrR (cupin superfamily)
MKTGATTSGCGRTDSLVEFALGTLPSPEVSSMQVHISKCADCQQQMAAWRPVVDSFVLWPTDVLRPSSSLWGRLAVRIAADTGDTPVLPLEKGWIAEPEWSEVAPGIECKILAKDHENERVSMLVRLAPGANYPPHDHGGTEELHLLDGELWIDDKKLYPGDYNRAERGSADTRVWTETGCTCVLVTSTRDVLR